MTDLSPLEKWRRFNTRRDAVVTQLDALRDRRERIRAVADEATRGAIPGPVPKRGMRDPATGQWIDADTAEKLARSRAASAAEAEAELDAIKREAEAASAAAAVLNRLVNEGRELLVSRGMWSRATAQLHGVPMRQAPTVGGAS